MADKKDPNEPREGGVSDNPPAPQDYDWANQSGVQRDFKNAQRRYGDRLQDRSDELVKQNRSNQRILGYNQGGKVVHGSCSYGGSEGKYR